MFEEKIFKPLKGLYASLARRGTYLDLKFEKKIFNYWIYETIQIKYFFRSHT
jgi:hypothetical protein